MLTIGAIAALVLWKVPGIQEYLGWDISQISLITIFVGGLALCFWTILLIAPPDDLEKVSWRKMKKAMKAKKSEMAVATN